MRKIYLLCRKLDNLKMVRRKVVPVRRGREWKGWKVLSSLIYLKWEGKWEWNIAAVRRV